MLLAPLRGAQRAITRATAIAESGEITLAVAEAELWTALLAVGRALMTLFLARPRHGPTRYEHDGARYALDTATRRSTEVVTRFGKVQFSRSFGRALSGRTACSIS